MYMDLAKFLYVGEMIPSELKLAFDLMWQSYYYGHIN